MNIRVVETWCQAQWEDAQIPTVIPTFVRFPMPSWTTIAVTAIQISFVQALKISWSSPNWQLATSHDPRLWVYSLDRESPIIEQSNAIARIANRIRQAIDRWEHQLLVLSQHELLATWIFVYEQVMMTKSDPTTLWQFRSHNLWNSVALLNNLAEYFSLNWDFETAKAWYKRAIEVALLIGARQYCFDAYYGLSLLAGSYSPENVTALTAFAADAFINFYDKIGWEKLLDGKLLPKWSDDFTEMRQRWERNINQAEILRLLSYFSQDKVDLEEFTSYVTEFEWLKRKYIKSKSPSENNGINGVWWDHTSTKTTLANRIFDLHDAQPICQIEDLIAKHGKSFDNVSSRSPLLSKYSSGNYWTPTIDWTAVTDPMERSLVFADFLYSVDLRFSLMQALTNHILYSWDTEEDSRKSLQMREEILYRLARTIGWYPTNVLIRNVIEDFLRINQANHDVQRLVWSIQSLQIPSAWWHLTDILQRNSGRLASETISWIFPGASWGLMLHDTFLMGSKESTPHWLRTRSIQISEEYRLNILIPETTSNEAQWALRRPEFSTWLCRLLQEIILEEFAQMLANVKDWVKAIESSLAEISRGRLITAQRTALGRVTTGLWALRRFEPPVNP